MNVLSLDPSLVCSSTTGASETVLAGVDAAAGEFDDDMAFRSSVRLAAFFLHNAGDVFDATTFGGWECLNDKRREILKLRLWSAEEDGSGWAISVSLGPGPSTCVGFGVSRSQDTCGSFCWGAEHCSHSGQCAAVTTPPATIRQLV